MEKCTYTTSLISMLFHRWNVAHDPALCTMNLTEAASDPSALGLREGSLAHITLTLLASPKSFNKSLYRCISLNLGLIFLLNIHNTRYKQ